MTATLSLELEVVETKGCERMDTCPMTGGDCPTDQATIDKCPEC